MAQISSVVPIDPRAGGDLLCGLFVAALSSRLGLLLHADWHRCDVLQYVLVTTKTMERRSLRGYYDRCHGE